MDYITNPLTGRKIKVNGKTHKRLLKNQTGGTILLASLPNLTNLVIPGGLALASHYAHKYLKEQHGRGRGRIILNNPMLKTWLTNNQINQITPSTLVPMGLLHATYNQYLGEQISHNFDLLDMIDPDDLEVYMKKHNLRSLTPQTKLPFAVVMGPDVFKQYI